MAYLIPRYSGITAVYMQHSKDIQKLVPTHPN